MATRSLPSRTRCSPNCSDAYTDLAEAVEEAARGPASVRGNFEAAVLSYRRWAIGSSTGSC
ncbi:MAG: hypothetical protein R6X29_11355 [Acidimicrobiia bacterium]|jgi:hypothetical protein